MKTTKTITAQNWIQNEITFTFDSKTGELEVDGNRFVLRHTVPMKAEEGFAPSPYDTEEVEVYWLENGKPGTRLFGACRFRSQAGWTCIRGDYTRDGKTAVEAIVRMIAVCV